MTQATTRGMYITSFLAFAEREGGPKLADELRRLVNAPANYSALSRYPIEHLVWMQEVAATRLYPQRPVEEAMYDFGYRVFGTFADSMFGRIGLNLVGRDIGQFVERLPAIYVTANRFGRVRSESVGGEKYLIRFDDYRTYPHYQHGVIRAGLDFLKHPVSLALSIESLEKLGEGEVRADFEFTITKD